MFKNSTLTLIQLNGIFLTRPGNENRSPLNYETGTINESDSEMTFETDIWFYCTALNNYSNFIVIRN